MNDLPTPAQVLKKYFGYDAFRPMQAEIIGELLQGRDVLVLMPTGGGKSVCYQVPAMLLPGVTIVVSPLIALMKDQVEGLLNNGIPAAFLNSTQSASQLAAIEQECLRGEIKLLYVSPEKLLSASFQWLLRQLPIQLFAIDEAHCISGWGHDFRPEYAQLSTLKSNFPDIPVVALTATADKLIRQDIITQLNLEQAKIFVSSFDRKNLSLTVLPGTNRLTQLMNFLDARPNQSGIIYCLSRNSTEQIATKLYGSGYRVGHYHAGMSTAERTRTQEAFLKDDIQVICATIAFGMGIDKSNVRWVIHYNMPKNMEGYYQEIGRAGRDGLRADTVLFYSFRDVIAWREIIGKTIEDQRRRELLLARLDRMQQYAESHFCRRRMLLNYFSEHMPADCGNCDVCRKPRTSFDGTILAQKALSAVIRLNESVTAGTLIDVLRGSRSTSILEKGYDKIKTYGAGADLRTDEWREYLQQMINSGVLEIAYHQKYALHRGALSQRILNGSQPVMLVKPERVVETAAQPVEKTVKPPTVKEQLFERLRLIRKQLAQEQNVPPYIICTDLTLTEMVQRQPATPQELSNVSGMSQRKIDQYGTVFLQAIKQFALEQSKDGVKVKGATYLLTYELWKQGYSPEEIAKNRELNVVTVQSHLITLWERGFDVAIFSLINPADVEIISRAIPKLGGKEAKAKEIFEHFRERYDYFTIRLAMVSYAKNAVQ